MNVQKWVAAAVIGSVIAATASAQAVQLKRRGATTGTGTVSITHQGEATLVTIKASNADVKSLFQDIGTKAGARILVSTAVSGAITSTVDALPLETALQTVGNSSGLAIRKLLVPQSIAAGLKAPAAAALAASLAASVTSATVVDPASGHSVTLTFATTAPKQTADQAVVYLVVRSPKAGAGDAVQTAIADATESMSQLTSEQRMQALRDLQRQAFDSMTPEELEKMRQSGPPPGGFGGGPGGSNNGGPGGPPSDGFGGGPGGPPPTQ